MNPDHTAPMNEEPQMRNIEKAGMAEVERVRSRLEMDITRGRVSGI